MLPLVEIKVVPPPRLELGTRGLRDRCSTIELQRQESHGKPNCFAVLH